MDTSTIRVLCGFYEIFKKTGLIQNVVNDWGPYIPWGLYARHYGTVIVCMGRTRCLRSEAADNFNRYDNRSFEHKWKDAIRILQHGNMKFNILLSRGYSHIAPSPLGEEGLAKYGD